MIAAHGSRCVDGDLADAAPGGELAAESLLFISVTTLGAQAIFVAVTLNRVNDRAGYWLNLVVLGAVDVAFLVLLVLPGHVDLVGGTAGPVIWLVAPLAGLVAYSRVRTRVHWPTDVLGGLVLGGAVAVALSRRD